MLITLNTPLFAGKLSNIVGIAKSTEDDINNDNIAEIAKSTTEDYHFKIPLSAPVVKKAPKPKTIPQGKHGLCEHFALSSVFSSSEVFVIHNRND